MNESEIKTRIGFMDEKLNDIKDDVSEIKSDVSELVKIQQTQSTILEHQHESLKEHMRRSDLLEQHIEKVRVEMKPVEDHVKFVKMFLRVVLGLLAGAASIAAIARFLL